MSSKCEPEPEQCACGIKKHCTCQRAAWSEHFRKCRAGVRR